MFTYDQMSVENQRVVDSLTLQVSKALLSGGYAAAEGDTWSRLRDAIADYLVESAAQATQAPLSTCEAIFAYASGVPAEAITYHSPAMKIMSAYLPMASKVSVVPPARLSGVTTMPEVPTLAVTPMNLR